MKIGIGLPNHVAGVGGRRIVEWARRAEERGFESVTTIDRLIYPSIDSIVALGLAAGATTDLSLVTNILLAPLYQPVVLAKQLAGLAEASGNRLALGVAVGARKDDYGAAGVDFGSRGRLLDEAPQTWRQIWSGEPLDGDAAVTPRPVTIPVLFGGTSKAAVRRATTLGDGWVAGAMRDYDGQESFLERIRDGWREAGRDGAPMLHASANFAIGDDAAEAGRGHLNAYYGFIPEYAAMNVADMITTPEDAHQTVQRYRDMGFDRLLFHPTVASLEQVDRLADAVL